MYTDVTEINAQFPAKLTIEADTVVKVVSSKPILNSAGLITDQINVEEKFYKATGTSTFGETSNVTLTGASKLAPADVPGTDIDPLFAIKIDYSTTINSHPLNENSQTTTLMLN